VSERSVCVALLVVLLSVETTGGSSDVKMAITQQDSDGRGAECKGWRRARERVYILQRNSQFDLYHDVLLCRTSTLLAGCL
jgi:hypothetical protein